MSEPTSFPQSDRIDELLTVLADRERRAIITHLEARPQPDASLADLTTAFATQTGLERDRARIRLHHCHLPKLADILLVEYDSNTATIRYHGDDDVESLVATIERVEARTESS